MMGSEISFAECLTPQGRGGVATIQVTGHLEQVNRFFFATNTRPIQDQPLNRICYGTWGERHPEDVVCLRSQERLLEIHCHGGMAAVNRILGDLQQSGIGSVQVPVSQDVWERLDSEFSECLQQATTQRTAHMVLRQATLFPQVLHELIKMDPGVRKQKIAEMLAWVEFGRHLIVPWKVVLCGPPNVGKSSLINALVGYSRSVVFDQPGTTRDVVTVQTAFEGWPIELSDTAGLRETYDPLEACGIQKAKEHIEVADLMIFVVVARTGVLPVELDMLDTLTPSRALCVLNKIDLLEQQSLPKPVVHMDGISATIPVSAIQNVGIDDLAKQIVHLLIPSIPDQTQAFPVTSQQIEFLKNL